MYKKNRAGIFFLLPGVVWILVFTLFPLIFSLGLSFTDRQLARPTSGQFIGAQNYGTALGGILYSAVPPDSPLYHLVSPLLTNPDLRVGDTVGASIFMSLASVIITILLGTFIAWLFNNDIPLVRIFRSVMTMPLFAAPVALGFLGLILFNEQSGIINYVIRGITGQYVPWFTQPWWARTAVVLIDAWQWTPFVFIVVLAAIQSEHRSVQLSCDITGRFGLGRRIRVQAAIPRNSRFDPRIVRGVHPGRPTPSAESGNAKSGEVCLRLFARPFESDIEIREALFVRQFIGAGHDILDFRQLG